MNARPANDEIAAEFHDAAARLLADRKTVTRLLADARAQGLTGDWRAIGEAGWFRILQPEVSGGLGLSLVELAAVFRAVGAQPVRGPLAEAAVCLPLLDDLFVERGARAAIDQALDGRAIVTFAEPLEAPGCEAMAFDANRLCGTAPLVPFANEAAGLIVAAGTSEDAALIYLERGDYAVEPVASLDPTTSYATVRFDVTPATDRVLARGTVAHARRIQLLAARRLMAAAELAGATAALTAMSVDYAKMRVQFSQPIGRFQAVQHMLAALAARSTALSSLVRASVRDARDDPEGLEDRAVIAFAYAIEIGRYAAEEAMQIHGGIGFTQELALHLHYRRVLTHQGRLGDMYDLWPVIGSRQLGPAASGRA
jgi:alkylation response protein AidB-like acyl-CoA dehydrogenase